jgi:hypothetical protein
MLWTTLVTACAQSVVVETDFPEPLVPTLPLHMGVHYPEALTAYVYTEMPANDVKWTFDIGAANKKLFDSIFFCHI